MQEEILANFIVLLVCLFVFGFFEDANNLKLYYVICPVDTLVKSAEFTAKSSGRFQQVCNTF